MNLQLNLLIRSTLNLLTSLFIEEPEETFKYQLVKKSSGDTTHYLYYYKKMRTDDNLFMEYKLLTKDDKIVELINYPYLEIVDTLYVQDKNRKYRLMKYEVVNPPADGDGAVLFNEEYGVMANIDYGWLGREILTNWNGKELSDDIVTAFLSDSIARATKRK